jgi:hypothetical protein
MSYKDFSKVISRGIPPDCFYGESIKSFIQYTQAGRLFLLGKTSARTLHRAKCDTSHLRSVLNAAWVSSVVLCISGQTMQASRERICVTAAVVFTDQCAKPALRRNNNFWHKPAFRDRIAGPAAQPVIEKLLSPKFATSYSHDQIGREFRGTWDMTTWSKAREHDAFPNQTW